MKNIICFLVLLIPFSLLAQTGYKVGDKVDDFTLPNVKDKSTVSLNNYASSKAIVIVFTSHTCPYTKIYEQRAQNFVQEYEQKGVTFLLVNPNNPASNPEESAEEMAEAAKERGYRCPYLSDATQKVTDKFGASKTPEVFVLKNQGGSFVLKYKGAIDDNPQMANDVTSSYLKDALDSVLSNQPVKISEKRATGCMIHR
ncbi:MAG TPA: redoxin domain-containing protein [Cytophagaceae bacterium]|jgi:peroxiredoxin|nr:redoxin domain-containing protein [Cytophagaceae bacterium]